MSKQNQNYRNINPNRITYVCYNVTEAPSETPSTTISLDIPWSVHNIHTVSYSTLYNDIHTWGYDCQTIASSPDGIIRTYSFNITDAYKQWLNYALNDGGYTYDIGFVLRAVSGSKIFASVENAAISTRPNVMVYYTEDTSVSDGTYYIRNVNSGKYLDVAGADTADGTNVWQYEFNRSAAQHWKVQYLESGCYALIPGVSASTRLDADGASDVNNANIQIYSSNGSPAQRWRLIQNADGTYRIMPRFSDGRGMEVTGAGTANGINVVLYDYWGGNNQRWVLESTKTTYINSKADTSYYDRSAAVAYASQYACWQDSDQKLDTPGYIYFETGNCTNFVSQCLVAGGLVQIPGSRTSDSSWYYLNRLSSYTWAGAENFSRHLGRNNYGVGNQRVAETIVYNTVMDAYNDWSYLYMNAYNGDVLQIFNCDGIVHHSMLVYNDMVTTQYNQFDIQYAQHTSNKIDSLYRYLLENKNNTTEGLILHKIN